MKLNEKQVFHDKVGPRIGLLGLVHETNTFAAGHTEYADFAAPADREPVLQGAALLCLNAGVWGGMLSVLTPAKVELVPLYRAGAAPSSLVSACAWTQLLDECVASVRSAIALDGPLDGLVVELHGAMAAQQVADCEGTLLKLLRQCVGPQCVIVATLDFHANVSLAMVANTQRLVPFLTYPHVDMQATGVRAANTLLALLASEAIPGRPCWSQGRFLIPLVSQYTGDGPMHQFMQACEETAQRHRVEVAFCAGFPLADTPDTGPSIVVYPAHAQALSQLSQQLDSLRAGFASAALDIDTAIEQLKANQQGLTLLADVADNPGAGCAANDVSLLCALHDKGIKHSLVATLNLPQWAADAHKVGVGQCFQQTLPGRDEPIVLQVLAISEGRYLCTGPMWDGRAVDQGLTARLAWGDVELIVASRPVQALDLGALICADACWEHYRVIALKSSVHFRAAFGPLARRVNNVDILRHPGQPEWVPPYRQLRAGVAPSPSHVQL